MFDLANSFLASIERDGQAIAIVDGKLRLSYVQWGERIGAVIHLLTDTYGLVKGDHLVTVLQNRWEAATLHWACQFLGVIITPVNWRSTHEELAFFIENSAAKLCVTEGVSFAAAKVACRETKVKLLDLDLVDFFDLPGVDQLPVPDAAADELSLMLYTSGTTGKPKGVPRQHYAERAAAIAHLAQNTYRSGERTLGVMPLYHTMGVRSLIAMSLIGGTFVCLPKFDVAEALRLISQEKITCLYLVPTMYHAILHSEEFANSDVSSVKLLGFAGASMTDDLLQRLNVAFQPELFVNHYGSSEIYTFTIHANAPAKPGSAGRAGLNQRIRIVKAGESDPDAQVKSGEEGEIIASMQGDEAFEGYWKRPDSDLKSLIGGWYFTGDIGRFDLDGDLFVTGRTDDMIITGGENVSPIEVESHISTLDGVDEVAVVGLPDPKWGQIVTAFIKQAAPLTSEQVIEHCHENGLARFKTPRRCVFVEEIPKSPVGKLLRRLLIAGEYIKVKVPDSEQI